MDGRVDLIKVQNVSQSFQVGSETLNVLKTVNFNIADNTFNIIYGPSGSGKSTLLNILTGLQKPTSGLVTFENEDVYSFKPNKLAQFRAHRVGFVYQQNFWVKSLNVIENVSLPLYFLGYDRKKALPLAQLALDRVDMGSYAKKRPLFLSGGEQQRIAMARALVNDPMFIIADEPTGNLDSTNGDKIMSLLQNARDEFKRTIILVTHNMEYLPLADHLIHIEDGFVQDMKNDDIAATTNQLMSDLKGRVDALLANRKKGPHQ
jgi:ABC-type lipoprotein export system ATPase subunit